ncbi:hypothetical protein [Stieleria varia]|uniref:hypothetical protein n=1 Tax=Stieleria varia TaxID=2528005 RepID=UPI0011B51174|nr:hypothetical protein [Stieleria varia]
MIGDCVDDSKLQESGGYRICQAAAFHQLMTLSDIYRRNDDRSATGNDRYQSANVFLDQEIQSVLLPHQKQNQEPSVANKLRCPER